jgi:hypothetical protein
MMRAMIVRVVRVVVLHVPAGFYHAPSARNRDAFRTDQWP